MRRPTRNLLYVVLGVICVALLVQGVGFQLPRVLKMLTAVSAAPSSPAVSEAASPSAEAASAGPTVLSADLADRSCTAMSSIESGFNATPIAEGNVIWFNSAIHADGLGSGPATIFLKDSTITFAANGTS